MARPFSFSTKKPGGNIYVQFALPNGGRTYQKSTGTSNSREAEKIAMEWLVKGDIPKRINSKNPPSTSIDKIRFFNDLRTADFDESEIQNIVKILTERKYLKTAVLTDSRGSRSVIDFLLDFWDYETSPYVKEKHSKGQSIGKHYTADYQGEIRNYWAPLLEGKCIAEITRHDVENFFVCDAAKGLAPKTINKIISALTIPMKWAFYHEMTTHNCFDGIIKCSGKSKERKILTMDMANKLMEVEWENELSKIANELAMHTGLRNGELKALTLNCIGDDVIYVTQAWGKYEKMKCCKNGEARQVPIPIPHHLTLKLRALGETNPHTKGDNALIFYSTVPDKPLEDRTLNKYLRKALKEIGYENPDEISFYSWRHFFCSRMLDYISDKRIVMALSGHKTEAMLNHYGKHLEDDRVVSLARDVMKKVFIDKHEDEQTIKDLTNKLENLENQFTQEAKIA